MFKRIRSAAGKSLRHHPRVKFVASVCAYACASVASAGVVKVTMADGTTFALLGANANGTFGARAYSDQTGVAGTPNATISGSAQIMGVPLNQLNPPMIGVTGFYLNPNAIPIRVPTPFAKVGAGGRINGPVVNVITAPLGPTVSIVNNRSLTGAFNKSGLTMLNDGITVTSTTGQYTGMASVTKNLLFFPIVGGIPLNVMSASASSGAAPAPKGNAAAQAADPYDIPSGTAYTYNPTVDVGLDLDASNETGSALAFAVDSSTFTSDTVDNFDQDGNPLNQSLWYLAVQANSVTSDTSTANVDFVMNPQALSEIQFPSSFLSSLGSFSGPTSEANLIDDAMDLELDQDLTENSGEVDLDEVDPFPSGTTFTAAGSGVEYEEGTIADISVPEPCSSLVSLGMFGLATLGCRRRN